MPVRGTGATDNMAGPAPTPPGCPARRGRTEPHRPDPAISYLGLRRGGYPGTGSSVRCCSRLVVVETNVKREARFFALFV